jgi:uncharacterized protein YsxB (DUF464 family)
MITILLMRTPSGFLRRITATGHAGFADKGLDIICAAVSVIVQTAVGGLQDVARIQPAYIQKSGRIECGVADPESLDPKACDAARIIMETAAIGCRQIEQSYGSRYVSVREAAYTE